MLIGQMQSCVATSVKVLKAKVCRKSCEAAVQAAETQVAQAVTDAPTESSAFTSEIAASFDDLPDLNSGTF